MKRFRLPLILAVIALITILTGTLAGCSNTPAHKVLTSPWANEETAVYDVVRTLLDEDKDAANNPKINGTQTIKLVRKNTETITVGNETMDNFTGTIATFDMTMDDGSYLKATIAFNAKLRPALVHRESFVKGYEFNHPTQDTTEKLMAKYVGKSYTYEHSKNDTTAEISLDLKSTWEKTPFFDTLELYMVARSSFTAKKKAFNPMTVKVPSYTEKAIKQASMNIFSNDLTVKVNEVDYKTTCVAINYLASAPLKEGMPNYAYFANEAVGNVPQYALVKIIEGSMEYNLKSFA